MQCGTFISGGKNFNRVWLRVCEVRGSLKMRDFSKNIHFDSILCPLRVMSRKQVFQALAAEAAAHCALLRRDILARLNAKEKISGSGIGDGVAIPHLHFRRLAKPYIAFAKMDHLVDFDALDGKPVDLVCAVFSPEKDGPLHLQRLSLVSRMLRSPALRERLREAQNPEDIRIAMMSTSSLLKAA